MLGDRTLGVLGVGNMGEAFVRGVLHGELVGADRILVSARRPERAREVAERLGVSAAADNADLVDRSHIVLVAVKPQQFESAVGPVRDAFRVDHMVLSVLAGVTTRYIEDFLGKPVPVVRAMPNTPALIGEGATAYCRGRFARAEHALMAHAILDVVGVAVELDENLLDAVTAVSGSGPAYFFYLIEGLVAAGVELGLPERVARLLVKQTALGAARLAKDLGEDPAELRRRVTSKGGTTEAALSVLRHEGFLETFHRAVAAARRRAEELGTGGGSGPTPSQEA